MKQLFVVLVFALTGFVVPSAHASEITCHGRYRTDSANVNDGSTGDDDWLLKVNVHYTYCRRIPGHDFVKGPYFVQVGYNQEGTHMNCSKIGFSTLKSVNFDPYFWDQLGRNFNPDTIKVPCDESTWNSKAVSYKGEKLYTDGDGKAPHAKFNVHVDKYGSEWEAYATLLLSLRNCDGQGTTEC